MWIMYFNKLVMSLTVFLLLVLSGCGTTGLTGLFSSKHEILKDQSGPSIDTESYDKIFNYTDKYGNRIKIKFCNHRYLSDDIHYIIDVESNLSNESCDIHLRLVDINGFELCSFLVGKVSKNFTGTIKGKYYVNRSIIFNIANAELYLKVDSTSDESVMNANKLQIYNIYN